MDRKQYLESIYSHRVRLMKQDKTVLPLLADNEDFAAQSADDYLQAEALANRAFEAIYIKADYSEAIALAKRALDLAGSASIDLLSKLHLLIGRASIHLSNFQDARVQLYKALTYAEQIDSADLNRLMTQSEVYHALGMVNSLLKLPVERTREYLEKGLHFAVLANSRSFEMCMHFRVG
jgi:tetratricopeptide (TPR) repeat protein